MADGGIGRENFVPEIEIRRNPKNDYRKRQGESLELVNESVARARALLTYWQKQGFEIKVWVEEGKYSTSNRGCTWEVGSDLVGGIPKDAYINNGKIVPKETH